jgi:Domain of unknown function (DUF3385)
MPLQEAAMRALGQVVSATGMVVRPYFHHPKLLDLLLTALRRGDRAAAGLRTEALRTFGLLGALDPVKLRICSGRAVDTLRRPLVAVQRCNTDGSCSSSSSGGSNSSSRSDSSELGDAAAGDSAVDGGDAISAAAAVDVTVPVVGGHADAAVFGAAAGVSVEHQEQQQQQQQYDQQQHDDSHVWGSAVEPWWLQRGSGRVAAAGGGVTVPDFGEELVEGRSALQCRYYNSSY